METNPAKPHIKHLLIQQPQGWQEHRIISALQSLPDQQFSWPFSLSPSQLALFKKHFMVMNALYQLQQEFVDQGNSLKISPLDISLTPLSIQNNDQQNRDLIDAKESSLAPFYLDWSHFYSATTDSVDQLLTQFWQKYCAYNEQEGAYRVLNLPVGSDRSTIEGRYRQLASKHHPDKGGCHEDFIEIRKAYEQLMKVVA